MHPSKQRPALGCPQAVPRSMKIPSLTCVCWDGQKLKWTICQKVTNFLVMVPCTQEKRGSDDLKFKGQDPDINGIIHIFVPLVKSNHSQHRLDHLGLLFLLRNRFSLYLLYLCCNLFKFIGEIKHKENKT